jgi:hypothetical protein
MPKKCRVCATGWQHAIDQGLRGGNSPRHLARMFNELSRLDIKRHQEKCLLAKLKTIVEEKPRTEAQEVA